MTRTAPGNGKQPSGKDRKAGNRPSGKDSRDLSVSYDPDALLRAGDGVVRRALVESLQVQVDQAVRLRVLEDRVRALERNALVIVTDPAWNTSTASGATWQMSALPAGLQATAEPAGSVHGVVPSTVRKSATKSGRKRGKGGPLHRAGKLVDALARDLSRPRGKKSRAKTGADTVSKSR